VPPGGPRRGRRRRLLGKLPPRRRTRDACPQPLEVHREIDPRQRLVEIIDVEYDVLLRGGECPEVHQMAVAASLDGNAGARLMLEVLGHHRGSAAQERERTFTHALVANRYQLRHTATIACGQDGDRIAIAGPEQLGVPLARHLCAQALAVRITLGERAPGGLGRLACDVKHLKRRTGLAAACALRRRQRSFPMADITRRSVSVPSLPGALWRRAGASSVLARARV